MIGCSFSCADRPFWLGCNCRKIMMEFFNEVQNNLFSWKGTFKYWWHPGLIQLIFKKKLSFFRPQPYFWPQLFEGWIALTTLTEGFHGVEATGNMALETGDNLLRKHQQSMQKEEITVTVTIHFDVVKASSVHFCILAVSVAKWQTLISSVISNIFLIFFGKFSNHGIVQKRSPRGTKVN